MKVYHLVKKFRNLTQVEQKECARTLEEGSAAIEIINEYCANIVNSIDKKLNNTDALYSQPGDNALKVAALLARREAHFSLLLLLRKDIELDVDQTKD